MKTSKTFLLSLAVIACLLQPTHLIASNITEQQEEAAVLGKLLPDAEGLITINDVSQSMQDHITNERRIAPNSPFKNTDIVRYDPETGFAIVGPVLEMPAEDMTVVSSGNYTYLPYYTKKLVNGSDEEFGVIIVGHKDIELARKFILSYIKALLDMQK